jgi:hypothetical protein
MKIQCLFFAICFLWIHTATGEIDRTMFKSREEVDSFNAGMIEEKGYTAQIEILQEWESLIEATKKMPVEKAVPTLAEMMVKASKYHIFQVRERFSIYDKSRDLLLATPGHSTFFLQKWKNNRHSISTTFICEYFPHVPSVETVGVLGELLADEHPRPPLAADRSNVEAVLSAHPNCDHAVRVLQKLLQDPPTAKGRYNFSTDLPKWRDWYEEVKAGRQTFRLVGDPTHYTLRGPSKRGAIGQVPRRDNRPALVSPTKPAHTVPKQLAPKIIPYLIVGLFLLAGIVYRLRRKAHST